MEAESDKSIVRLPLVGGFALQAAPILLTTVLVAFLDGFNRCPLFVLIFCWLLLILLSVKRSF
jgi:hypothetical protein